MFMLVSLFWNELGVNPPTSLICATWGCDPPKPLVTLPTYNSTTSVTPPTLVTPPTVDSTALGVVVVTAAPLSAVSGAAPMKIAMASPKGTTSPVGAAGHDLVSCSQLHGNTSPSISTSSGFQDQAYQEGNGGAESRKGASQSRNES